MPDHGDNQERLRELETLLRIDDALLGASDLETAQREVLDTLLRAFDCDRAWFVYPCDPTAANWHVPAERTRPEWPGAFSRGGLIPMTTGASEVHAGMLAADGPVIMEPADANDAVAPLFEQYSIRVLMQLAIHPTVGRPWLIGLHRCADGTHWTESQRRLFGEIGERIANGLGAHLDIQGLRQGISTLNDAQRIIAIGSWRHDLVTDEITWSDASWEMIGREPQPITPEFVFSIIHPDDHHIVLEAMRTAGEGRRFHDHVFRILRPDGEIRVFRNRWQSRYDDAGREVERIGTHQDISDQQQARQERDALEAQLFQAQKMEAIGLLAGGIAHDFNNLLHVISGYGNMALSDLDPDHPAHTNIELVVKAGQSAASLTGQLLAFSRRQMLEMSYVDLNELVADTMRMIRRLIGETLTLEVVPGPDLGVVRVDSGQIEQVLLNLCVNARDALSEGGTITIRTANAEIDEAFKARHSWARPGRYVLLSVSDTGSGMDDETIANIFEPFYTTKEVGLGTGLGLSTVYGLIKQHEGMIDVHSVVGEGTEFRIYLPLADRPIARANEGPTRTARGGTETILVADDDEGVLVLTRTILERAGYTVLTADDGERALQVFREHADEIDLVMLDLVMPKLGGKGVCERIRETRPDLLFLFSSGYAMDADDSTFVLAEDVHFLRKPYEPHALLNQLRTILQAEQGPASGRPDSAPVTSDR